MVQSKPYIVVEFEDGMQLIEKNWLNKAAMKAYWPAFTTMNRYYKAVREMENIQDTWTLFPVKRILAEAYSYEKGMQNLKEAELFSDLNSDAGNDTNIKSRRRKHAHQSIQSGTEGSDMESDHQSKLPPFPDQLSPTSRKRREHSIPVEKGTESSTVVSINVPHHTLQNSKSSKSESSKSKNSEADKDKQSVEYFDTQKSVFRESDVEINAQLKHPHSAIISTKRYDVQLHAKNVRKNANSTAAETAPTKNLPSSRTKTSTKAAPDKSHLSPHVDDNEDNLTFERFVVRSLIVLKNRTKSIHDTIQEIQKSSNSLVDNENIDIENRSDAENDIMSPFPLQILKKLRKVEKKLSQDSYRKELRMRLLKIRGTDFKACTNKLMDRLFSNFVGEKFSWLGYKGKRVFSTLQLCSLIFEIVGKVRSPILVTEEMISKVIKDWLRHAKGRLLKERPPKLYDHVEVAPPAAEVAIPAAAEVAIPATTGAV